LVVARFALKWHTHALAREGVLPVERVEADYLVSATAGAAGRVPKLELGALGLHFTETLAGGVAAPLLQFVLAVAHGATLAATAREVEEGSRVERAVGIRLEAGFDNFSSFVKGVGLGSGNITLGLSS
jgi:hypothetical protein